MRFVGYYRTSTDDKGQDPHRQRDVSEAWAKANGHQIPAYVIDEGTSGATDPFQRQRFLEAVNLAEEHQAEAILVEALDRATRGGVEAFMVLKATLRLDYGLTIKAANTPAGLPPAIEELYEATMAMVARMFRDRLREQIKSGVARAKANGFPNGRPGTPSKPALTLAEQDLVRDLVLNQNAGVDKLALEISRARGAFDVGDPGARDRRKVGPTWVWKQVHRSQMVEVRERFAARSPARVSAIDLKQNAVRAIDCPSCPAKPNQTCQTKKGTRTAYHASRRKAAAEVKP